MLRILIYFCLCLCSCLASAQKKTSLFQVDMIVFTHLKPTESATDISAPLLAPTMQDAIPLQLNPSKAITPYHLLPRSSSQLNNEYWSLNHKPQYQILFSYSWLQPSNSKTPIALTGIHSAGWDIEGALQLQQSNYYLLNTQLFFSAPNSHQTAFMFSQKQRLKPGVVYYLDHPQAGMLIKVHQIT